MNMIEVFALIGVVAVMAYLVMLLWLGVLLLLRDIDRWERMRVVKKWNKRKILL